MKYKTNFSSSKGTSSHKEFYSFKNKKPYQDLQTTVVEKGTKRIRVRASQDSLDHAQLIIEALGVQSETVEITDMVDPLIARTPQITPLRKGNLMARARMIVLYDQSAAHRGLVIGTSNKTELLLGCGTLFGDMASALNPIGDLYKTQVRQLAEAIGVSQPIVDKPPSADLWIGQTDEDEMGLTYTEVDQLLYLLVDERYSPEEAIEAGFDGAYVERVWKLMRTMQFKRRGPLIAKLSKRTAASTSCICATGVINATRGDSIAPLAGRAVVDRHTGDAARPSAGAPLPASTIKIVVELEDEPAVVIFHAAQQVQRPATLATQMSRAQIARIDVAQQKLLAALRPLNAIILYRTQRVYNGIAAITCWGRPWPKSPREIANGSFSPSAGPTPTKTR